MPSQVDVAIEILSDTCGEFRFVGPHLKVRRGRGPQALACEARNVVWFAGFTSSLNLRRRACVCCLLFHPLSSVALGVYSSGHVVLSVAVKQWHHLPPHHAGVYPIFPLLGSLAPDYNLRTGLENIRWLSMASMSVVSVEYVRSRLLQSNRLDRLAKSAVPP